MNDEYKIPTRQDWLDYENEKRKNGLKDFSINPVLQEEYLKKIKSIIKKIEI